MKNIIITGGNSGLGFETAKRIAMKGDDRVILACRNDEKAQAAKEAIIAETGHANIETMRLDTSLMSSVRTFVDAYVKTYGIVDVLLENAGVSPAHSGVTAEGFETVFATNHLGHFLLANLLLPHMSRDARILLVTSDMHNPPGGLTWPGLEAIAHAAPGDRHSYHYSKLCNLYFTYELARRLKEMDSSITVNAFNPGFMGDTNFSGGTGASRAETIRTTMPERYSTLARSSDALAKLATEEEFAVFSGRYFDRSTNAAFSSELSYSRENAMETWEKSAAFCGL